MKKFNLLKGLAMSLLTLALCFVAFGAVKAKADGPTAVYDPNTDTIKVTSDSGSKVYYIDLGKSGKQKVKESKIQECSLSGSGNSKSGEIVLDNKEEGLKVAETKDIYLYYSLTDPASVVDKNDKIVDQQANLVIKGSKVKKFSVTLNYACAESGQITKVAFTVADDKGKTMTDGVGKVIYRYSEDGKEFGSWSSGSGLTADVLYKAIAATDGGKPTFEFKIKGDANTRGSKSVKVKVAKAAKAPKVKVDFLKGTVALKNGFDFYASSSSAAPTSLSGWKTILPTNKAGKASGSGVIIATVDFIPYAKASDDTSKGMFAKSTEKVKSVPVSELFTGTNANASEIYLYVRKSATAKKPASAISEEPVKITAQAAAPTFTAVSGETSEKKVTTFEYSSNSGDVEVLILKEAPTASTDLKDAKWVKLGNKGLILKKTKTKVGKSANTLGDTSYVLVRIAGVKNESLPSAYAVTKITKHTSASGDTYTWDPVQSN